MRAIEELESEEIKREGFKHIVKVLKDGYQNYGLGWSDDVLLEDIMSDLGSSMDELA